MLENQKSFLKFAVSFFKSALRMMYFSNFYTNLKIFFFKNFKAMNALRNKVTLIGNLGMDPEIKDLDGGRKLAKVSIATNESYKNTKGEKVTETQWHNLVAWGKTADFMGKYLQKGSEIVVEGKLINRNYTDKEGVKKYVTEIQVNDLLIVGSRK
jgi:single-strand DNA-binding protein